MHAGNRRLAPRSTYGARAMLWRSYLRKPREDMVASNLVDPYPFDPQEEGPDSVYMPHLADGHAEDP